MSTVTQEIIDKLAKSAALSGSFTRIEIPINNLYLIKGFPNVEAKTTTPMFSGVEKERKFDAHISECVKKIVLLLFFKNKYKTKNELDCRNS